MSIVSFYFVYVAGFVYQHGAGVVVAGYIARGTCTVVGVVTLL